MARAPPRQRHPHPGLRTEYTERLASPIAADRQRRVQEEALAQFALVDPPQPAPRRRVPDLGRVMGNDDLRGRPRPLDRLRDVGGQHVLEADIFVAQQSVRGFPFRIRRHGRRDALRGVRRQPFGHVDQAGAPP